MMVSVIGIQKSIILSTAAYSLIFFSEKRKVAKEKRN